MVFGFNNPDKQKAKKFKEFEKGLEAARKNLNREEIEFIQFQKVAWLTSRGTFYGKKGNIKQALSDFKEALSLKHDYFPAHQGIVDVYTMQKQFHEALEILSNIPRKMKLSNGEIGGFEFDIYFSTAMIYGALNDIQNTYEYATKALKAHDDPQRKERNAFVRRLTPEMVDDDSRQIEILKLMIQECAYHEAKHIEDSLRKKNRFVVENEEKTFYTWDEAVAVARKKASETEESIYICDWGEPKGEIPFTSYTVLPSGEIEE